VVAARSERLEATLTALTAVRLRRLYHQRAAAAMGREVPEPTDRDLRELEGDWEGWLGAMFPGAMAAPFGEHHRRYWELIWSIEAGERPRPIVMILARGGGKSTCAQGAVVALGARRKRRYGLYVSGTQDQADKHLADVENLLGSPGIERYYPDLARRKVNKYGHSRGWRRNRLWTASGFVVDAMGFDTAIRGIKAMNQRPDFIVIDDVDAQHDSPEVVRKKIDILTGSILPAGSGDCAVLAIQNVVHPDGVFARLGGVSKTPADFLADRVLIGPIPAVVGLTYEQREDDEGRLRFVITGGTATWEGQSLTVCQHQIDTMGMSAFLREAQHQVGAPPGGMFSHLRYQHVTRGEMPALVRVEVWVDPAVTDTDQSDAHGIQADGLGVDGRVYRLFSWEDRTTPEDSLRRAIAKAVELGSLVVGVETDQGGDTWRSVYERAWERFAADWREARPGRDLPRRPDFVWAKAGQGHGPKVHRASQMLADYEAGGIVHVTGTHETLEAALFRYPLTKPLDLVDAGYWSWASLRNRFTPTALPESLEAPSIWSMERGDTLGDDEYGDD
jgi:hypothetical protein